MDRKLLLAVVILLFVPICRDVRAASDQPRKSDQSAASLSDGPSDIPFRIGGVGGVYFLASPGELVVEVEKRDRNRRGRQTELRAILAGPDRHVLQEATIPDDGKPRGSGLGPRQRVRLTAQVGQKGIFVLNVTVSQDRYGDSVLWGFRTNCPHYLIETSRGHRDERHQEPIVLQNPDQPGNVCFVPRVKAFDLDLTGLPKGGDALSVYDAKGSLIQTLPVGSDGTVSHTFSADVPRDTVPWRLHLPIQQATIHIDGVTRWDGADRYPDLSYWTPELKSYFPFRKYRWLLTPYSRIVYGGPGEQGQLTFQVHNNSVDRKTVQLAVEPADGECSVQLSSEGVVLGARKSAPVTVRYTVPAEGKRMVCRLRATPVTDPEFSTYSTLTVVAAESPASQRREMPIVLRPYQHENEQFGYVPDYPVENQLYFDLKNQPVVRTGSGIAIQRDGQWVASGFRTAVQRRIPTFEGQSFGMPSTKVAFDSENHLYVLATAGRKASLLHSADAGKSFSAYVIPGREDRSRSFDFEQFSGNNVPDGPPPIVRFTRTGGGDKKLRWRRTNDLELFTPTRANGVISLREPTLVSTKCIGLSTHSGIPASVVSRGDKVHVVWGEATEPDADVPGVPTYVATYDRKTRRLGTPALVGYGPPANDVHNSPSITMDSQGTLHVLAGTHGQPFPYARSLKPNDAHSGWTEAVPVGEGVRQTYIGLVCGPDNTLHLVFRMWRSNTDPFPNSYHATLAYQRKRPGKPWEAPRVLVVSALSEYSIFYHRLTIDRLGRLFLSYDYWSTFWFYRTDHRGNRRSVLMSPDGGDTWKLAESRDLE